MTSTDGRVSVLVATAAALPGLLLLAAIVAMLAGEAAGAAPVWFEPGVTLPEAAALRDAGLVMRMIHQGANPNAPGRIRAGIIRSDAYTMTPLEAAIAVRRVEILDLLMAHGAVVDDETRRVLVCFARRLEAPDIETDLTRGQPPIDCAGVPAVKY